jgi:DNA-binding protein Fis
VIKISIILSISVTPSLKKDLEKHSKGNLSFLVREALKEYFKKLEGKGG